MVKAKKTLKKMKNGCVKLKQMALVTINALVIMYITSPISAYAASKNIVVATSYTTSLTKLKTVAISIVAAAGAIVLIYGGVKFAESFQKKDQNGEYSAIYTIAAGGIMMGISAVITALS